MKSLLSKSLANLRDKKSEHDGYVPKKSRRVKRKHTAQADGDTWTEHILLVDKARGRRRSYFRSKLTNKCVWDEPPSGASRVVLYEGAKWQ